MSLALYNVLNQDEDEEEKKKKRLASTKKATVPETFQKDSVSDKTSSSASNLKGLSTFLQKQNDDKKAQEEKKVQESKVNEAYANKQNEVGQEQELAEANAAIAKRDSANATSGQGTEVPQNGAVGSLAEREYNKNKSQIEESKIKATMLRDQAQKEIEFLGLQLKRTDISSEEKTSATERLKTASQNYQVFNSYLNKPSSDFEYYVEVNKAYAANYKEEEKDVGFFQRKWEAVKGSFMQNIYGVASNIASEIQGLGEYLSTPEMQAKMAETEKEQDKFSVKLTSLSANFLGLSLVNFDSNGLGQEIAKSDIEKPMREFSLNMDKIIASHPEWAEKSYEDWGDKALRATAGFLPSMIVSLASNLVVPIVGPITSGFLMEGGSSYKEAKASGADTKTAFNASVIYGSIAGAIELAQTSLIQAGGGKLLEATGADKKVEKFLTDKVKSDLLKNILKVSGEVISDAVANGGEEASQQIIQNIVAKTYDENRDIFDGAMEAFVGGTIGSSVLTSVGAGGKLIMQEVDSPAAVAEKLKENGADEMTFSAIIDGEKQEVQHLPQTESVSEAKNGEVTDEKTSDQSALKTFMSGQQSEETTANKNEVVTPEIRAWAEGKIAANPTLASKLKTDADILSYKKLEDNNAIINIKNSEETRTKALAGEMENKRATNESILKSVRTFYKDDNITSDSKIKVYRFSTDNISEGSFVTLSKEIAEQYGENRTKEISGQYGANKESQLWEATVPVKDLIATNRLKAEFVYAPEQTVTKNLAEFKQPSLADNSKKEIKTIDKFEKREVENPPTEKKERFVLQKEISKKIDKYRKMLPKDKTITVGEGYLSARNAGVYYVKTNNIRVNSINNVSVFAHEFTHFLDQNYNIASQEKLDKKTASDLRKFYLEYYPAPSESEKVSTQLAEGMATLLQKYVETPTIVTKEFPDLVKEFFTKDGKYYQPIIEEMIKDMNELVASYQSLSALDKFGAFMVNEPTPLKKGEWMNFGEKIRTIFADDIFPLEKINKITGREKTANDFSLWLRLYRGIDSLLYQNIFGAQKKVDGKNTASFYEFSGVNKGWIKTKDYNINTLVQNLGNMKMTNEFGAYLIARRVTAENAEYEQLKESLTNLDGSMTELKMNIIGLQDKASDLAKKQKEDKKITEKMVADANKELNDSLVELEGIKAMYDKIKIEADDLKEILKNDGFDAKEAAKAYLDNKDLFQSYEKMYDELNQSTLDLMTNPEIKLISQKEYRKLSSKKGYASFKRQFFDELVNEGLEEVSGADSFLTNKTSGRPSQSSKLSSLKQRKGSNRSIINPILSLIATQKEASRKAMKQLINNQILETAKTSAFGSMFQIVPLKTHFDKETGMVSFPQEQNKNIIMARAGDAIRVPILVDTQVKEIIDNVLTPANIGAFGKLVASVSRMFTSGTTALFPGICLNKYY